MYKINYICFGNASGYSQAAQDTIMALHQSGKYDVRVQYIFENSVRRAGASVERTNLFNQLSEKRYDKDCVQIFHCLPSVQRQLIHKRTANRDAKVNIGFATFETFDPPNNGTAGWVHLLNKNDSVICPSKFNVKVFKNAGVISPIHYIPHACSTELYNDSVEPMIKRDKFTFLFFADWRVRKNYQVLFESWLREFRPSDDVQLLVKTTKINLAKTTYQHIQKQLGYDGSNSAPVIFENQIFDEKELPSFLRSVDCYVSPTRGEGFGLPGLQSMFVKVPVIITNFSGCQEYANEDTATLLEPRGFELVSNAMDNLPQFRNKKWPIITVEDTKKAMRHVFENYDLAQKKSDVAYDYVKNNFAYQNITENFDKMMENINYGTVHNYS